MTQLQAWMWLVIGSAVALAFLRAADALVLLAKALDLFVTDARRRQGAYEQSVEDGDIAREEVPIGVYHPKDFVPGRSAYLREIGKQSPYAIGSEADEEDLPDFPEPGVYRQERRL